MRDKVKVLYVHSTTDKLFPPSIAPAVMAKLKTAGVDAQFFELKSDLGSCDPDKNRTAARLLAHDHAADAGRQFTLHTARVD